MKNYLIGMWERRKRLVFILSIISISIAFIVECLIMSFSLEHNPQGEFCTIVAYQSDTPSVTDKTYVKIGSEYVPYDTNNHKNNTVFYINNTNLDINYANWIAAGNPCALNIGHILVIFSVTLFTIFIQIFFIIILTIIPLAESIYKLRNIKRR